MPSNDDDRKLISQELGDLHSKLNETQRKLDGVITAIKVIAVIVIVGGGFFWLGRALQ